MARLIAALLPFVPLLAYAQAAETPAEPTNMVGVIAFLVLFIGSIVGFIGYVWWQARNGKSTDQQ